MLGCTKPLLEETVCLPFELEVLRENARTAIEVTRVLDTQAIARESTTAHNGVGHEGALLSDFFEDHAIRCGLALDGESHSDGSTHRRESRFLVNIEGESFLLADLVFQKEDAELLNKVLEEISVDEKLSVSELARQLVLGLMQGLEDERAMNEEEAAIYIHNEILEQIGYSILIQAVEIHETGHYIHPLTNKETREHNEDKSEEERKLMCQHDKIYGADEVYKIALVNLHKAMQDFLREDYPATQSHASFPTPVAESKCLGNLSL